MNYAAATIKNTEKNRHIQIAFWMLAAAIIALAVMYMYLVNKTVWNVVAKQNMEKNMATLNSELSEKEFEYISSVSGITMETASKMGFVSAADKTIFVSRVDLGKNVAIR
jgi:hypothetical protein